MAFSISIQCNNNNNAKAIAVEIGVKWYYRQGYIDFTLELDSTLIVNMITNGDFINRKLKQTIDNMLKIKVTMLLLGVQSSGR